MGNKQSSIPSTYHRLNCLDMPSSDRSSDSSKKDEDCVAEYAATVISSRTWEAEVMSFVDEHCIVFVDDNEDKIEHTRLHGEYTDLVHRVLRERLSEVGVTKEDLAKICGPSSSFSTQRIKKSAIEQYAAKDDFSIFKQMMTRRNKDLEPEMRQKLQKERIADCESEEVKGQDTCEALPYLSGDEVNSDEETNSDTETEAIPPLPPPPEFPEFSVKQEDLDAYEYVDDEQLRLLFAAANKILDSPEPADDTSTHSNHTEQSNNEQSALLVTKRSDEIQRGMRNTRLPIQSHGLLPRRH